MIVLELELNVAMCGVEMENSRGDATRRDAQTSA